MSATQSSHCDLIFAGLTETESLAETDPPVIAIGHQLSPENIERLLDTPVTRFLAYPFVVNALRDCLQLKGRQSHAAVLHLAARLPVLIESHTSRVL